MVSATVDFQGYRDLPGEKHTFYERLTSDPKPTLKHRACCRDLSGNPY